MGWSRALERADMRYVDDDRAVALWSASDWHIKSTAKNRVASNTWIGAEPFNARIAVRLELQAGRTPRNRREG
jgi:hypothetical protein